MRYKPFDKIEGLACLIEGFDTLHPVDAIFQSMGFLVIMGKNGSEMRHKTETEDKANLSFCNNPGGLPKSGITVLKGIET